MGMYTLREIFLRNYDSALGASPLGDYHNSFMKFFITRTRPYINKYICLVIGLLITSKAATVL